MGKNPIAIIVDELEDFPVDGKSSQVHLDKENDILYTDGMKYFVEKADSKWVLEMLGSFQRKVRHHDNPVTKESLTEGSNWTLTSIGAKGALPFCVFYHKDGEVGGNVELASKDLSNYAGIEELAKHQFSLSFWIRNGVVGMPMELL